MVVLEARVDALEPRVDALESEVRQMRADWKEVHQAQTRVLNALRKTQVEHGKAIDGLRTDVDGLRTEFDGLRTEFAEMRTEFAEFRDEVRLGFVGIAQSLDYLINQEGRSRS